ncbi:isocitrate lyase 1 [Marasmius tenuissimus]|uniref:methylisocitrate lyase n=1 Tax=Marasmius tenuissimus TaxID=585030 RepID=A0ABR2ZXR8_9AGAR
MVWNRVRILGDLPGPEFYEIHSLGILGAEDSVVVKTNSEAATLITTNIDDRNYAFILGITNPNVGLLNKLMVDGERAGKSGRGLQEIKDKWIREAGLKTFGEAIGLGGLHLNGYISDLFARVLQDWNEGRKERELGCDVLTHQRWSGANYADNLIKTVTGGVSWTSAMGAGVTESQFGGKSKL